MEYQFTHTMHGVVAKCSMDHEAFARWLNTEISDDPQMLTQVLAEIDKCRALSYSQHEAVIIGREYSLYLSSEEVMVKANNLDMDFDDTVELEEGFHFYNEESLAFCGLEDFEAFLNAYQRFIKVYH